MQAHVNISNGKFFMYKYVAHIKFIVVGVVSHVYVVLHIVEKYLSE